MESLSYRLLLFVLIFTPLAFATVETWSLGVSQVAIAISFLLVTAARIGNKKPSLRAPATLPLLLLIAWPALQLLPLPAPVVRLLSPAAVNLYSPLLATDANTWLPLTVHPKATLLALCQWSSYALLYLLTVELLGTPARLKSSVVAVVVFGSLLAVEAILQKLTSPAAIYWFRPTPGGTPIGPWVYSNQFAGFMEMIFPLVIALFLIYRPQVHYGTDVKEKILALFTLPGANRHLLLGTGAVLVAVAIILSLSRGGIITLCLAFLLIAFLASRVTHEGRVRWGMVISVSVILIITWFGWQPIMAEFGSLWGDEGFNSSGRLPLFRDGLNIVADFPLTGSGAGTFRDIYAAYRSLPGETIYDHAHDDYLELLTDGGLIGFALGAWFVAAFSAGVIRALRQRREQYSILITTGALTGIIALLLHCFIDFQFPNGANGIYFFFLCGLAVSAANTRLHYHSRSTYLQQLPVSTLGMPALVALTLLLCSVWLTTGIYRAQNAVSSLQSLYLNPYLPRQRLQEIQARLSTAAALDPLEEQYRLRLGYVATLLQEKDRARREYLAAYRRNPTSGTAVQQLALALPQTDPQRVDQLLALGIEREPRVLARYLTYCRWLLAADRKERAVAVLAQAARTLTEDLPDLAHFLIRERFTFDELAQILPPTASAWFELGRTCAAMNRPDEAIRSYLKSFDYLANGKILAEYFRRPFELFRQQKNMEQAVAILRLAIRYLPDDPWFRIRLGDYYLRAGIPYRAREEYEHGLSSDPGNRELQQRLAELDSSGEP